MRNHFVLAILVVSMVGLLGGCSTTIVPMRPMQTIEMDVPVDDAAATQADANQDATTQAATQSSTTKPRVSLFQGQHGYVAVTSQSCGFSTTQAATTTTATTQAQAATGPTTMPSIQAATAPAITPQTRKITKIIDPNQTTRMIYDADYDNVWQQAGLLMYTLGCPIDRHDYRLGVMTTKARQSAQIVEPWRRDQTGFMHAMEDTVNNQRRTIRVAISTVPGKPKFYQIAVQVMVERQSNPTEVLGGPIFAGSSDFGTGTVTLRSDYTGTDKTGDYWTIIGRDPVLERKILDELFKHI